MCNDPIPNCSATKQISQSNIFEYSIHSDPAKIINTKSNQT